MITVANHDSFCLCARCVKRWQQKQDRKQQSSSSRGSGRGARFSTGGNSHVTINPTEDPKAPGGHYVSIGDDQDHSTAVYNPDGTLADVKANRDWRDVPRQN
jgi:hypothetical protein